MSNRIRHALSSAPSLLPRISRVTGVLTAVVAMTIAGVTPAQAADTATGFTVGSLTLATPADGGKYIYVDDSGKNKVSAPDKTYRNGSPYVDINRVGCLTNGTVPAWVAIEGWSFDQACPQPDIDHPLATIQAAITIARPGDVIVVREGVYKERLGYGAVAGTAEAPIVLQNYPGERAEVRGWIKLEMADYWTVEGIHWLWDKTMTGSAQAVVYFMGGTGWTFIRNEVRDSHGVANLLVKEKSGAKTTAQRKANAPHNYTIASNLILNNRGPDPTMDHNIYLMPTIWSSGGLITHNLIAGAPNGANIKASGSKDPYGAPWDVEISYNTLLGGASGVVIGMKARYISVHHNAISVARNSNKYQGGVKTYSMTYPGNVAAKDNIISTYKFPVRETGDLGPRDHIFVARTVNWPVTYTGSLAAGNIKFTKAWAHTKYGHNAGW